MPAMSDANLLSLAFLQNRPKAAAALLQDFTPEHCVDFLEQMPLEVLVPVIDSMASWPAARTLSLLPVGLTADILHGLPDAETETLLRLMSNEQRDALMAHMPAATAQGFANKLAFPISTVGAWMDTAVPRFTLDSSVDHCLDLVKRQQTHLGGIVIVVDERHRLVGLVEVEKLLTSSGAAPLAELLNTETQPLSARATLWEVEHHEGWTLFPSLPVVDLHHNLLGALTHSALRAGTARSADRTDTHLRFSILAHMGEAFVVVLGGLLATLAGIRPGPEPRPRPNLTTGDDGASEVRHES
jgi:Mg/Co/Ni transporter MgtE